MVDASLVLRLDAEGVERRVDRTGAGGLKAGIVVEAEEQFLAVADVVVDADGVQLLRVELGIVGAQGDRARSIDAESPAGSGGRAGEGSRSAAQVVIAVLQLAGTIGHRYRPV